jgi:chorismate mutase / prephenate dehydratase
MSTPQDPQPATADAPQLDELRRSIEETDQQLVEILARRLSLVDSIAAQKAARPGAIRDRQRERAVIARVEARAGQLGVSAPLVRRILEEIIAHSVARQVATVSGLAPRAASVRVAFQGVSYASSHLAARKYLAAAGLDGEFTGHRTFAAAAAALTSGEADLAFLPIENTNAGSINQVYDLLRTEDLHIVGEETLKLEHCLASSVEVPLSSIRCVLADPQSLEQCGGFLRSLPEAEIRTCSDAAEALAAAAQAKDPAQAAIGSPEAAEANGLCVLRRGIADPAEHWTRFVALARAPVRYDSRAPCKTSLVMATRHQRGALLRCLRVFADHNLQMTKLESRPRPSRPWEYMFFLDFEGNLADEAVSVALEELKGEALYLKVLGSYPAKAVRVEAVAGEIAPPDGTALPEETTSEAPAVSESPTPVPRPPHAYKFASRAFRSEDTIVRVGDVLIGGDGFTVMAGPCAVESKEQIEATAQAVRNLGARVLRGGVFKPRTSPYGFQGLGYAGLDLLVAAGRATGMPIVTEVLSPDQVRPIAEKADLLQVGARNMQNFQLLRELGKVDRPVLLKRGLSSTIDEWLAAAEYILSQGNGQVILCERGIRTFETATRNTLDLSAVAVLRERTHLPIVVDPSHGTGRRNYVAPMAWAARASGAHGLIIEVHPDPAHALSDGEQSLTPDQFGTLMRGLERVGRPVNA